MKDNDFPPGLKLRRTLRGHEGQIGQIAWSPDGRGLASPSMDQTIRIWDAETGEVIQSFEGHTGTVACVAWSPDGRRLASGSSDGTVRLWDVVNGESLRTFQGLGSNIWSVAWSPYGLRIAAGIDGMTVRLWDAQTGEVIRDFTGHSNSVYSVAWSPDGRMIASGAGDGTVRVWDAESGQRLQQLGHRGHVGVVAWSSDSRRVISGSDDETIRLWNAQTGQQENVLEGHTNPVISLSFSWDDRLLASKAIDGTVRLWRTDTWETVAVLDEPHVDIWIPGLAFHPALPILATLGEKDTIIRIWDLDLDVLLGEAAAIRSVHHITAKVVLVGDSGVGKTGLGWRLAHGHFKEHPSTHGQQFWVLDTLADVRADNAECETVLWDLAGQPDYRLIHGLFLDDAELALVVFDPTNRQDLLHGVDYWLQALAHRTGDRAPCRTILVGARTDRGDVTQTRDEIEAFCRDRGITGGYVSTSALTGDGLDKLIARMKGQIVWSEMAATTTTKTFKRIKDYVLSLKEDEARTRVLADQLELRRQLEAQDPDWTFTDDEMMTAVGHLAKYGYVQVLRTASGEKSILLAPDLLNNLAASYVLEARRNPRGLGALDEGRVLRNEYNFPELTPLHEAERAILLDAVIVLFLKNNICFREKLGGKTFLIFPELINRKKPRVEGTAETVDDFSYTVSGSVENVYASLVVLLGYTNTFMRTDQWQNQAEYVVEGKVCGFRQLEEREGEVDLVLYYATAIESHTKVLFQGLFESFLSRRKVTVARYPALTCDYCDYPLERAAMVRRIRKGRNFMYCDDCGEKINLPTATQSVLSEQDRRSVGRQQALADFRTRFEMALVMINALTSSRLKPGCFICYAWGVPEHEKWVEHQLAADLRKAGINVLLDRWHNAEVGADFVRFAERSIATSDAVVVVGTPLFLEKYENEDHVVAAEMDLINRLLRGSKVQKKSVLPALLEGDDETAFPPLMRGKVFADFRSEATYFATLFDLILTLYKIPFDSKAVADLRESLHPEWMEFAR